MAGLISARLLLTTTAILVGLLLRRSPYMMATTSPSSDKPWADTPMALIPTPLHATGKTDIFTTGASHMCMLHNAIFRGFNSIHNQAAHVKPADVPDFLGYCLTWHKFVVSHHDDEEAVLFPQVEALLDDKTVWAGTHEEHQAFLPGLAELQTYLTTTLSTPEKYAPADLLRILDSFRPAFEKHFRSEISTISALSSHKNAPQPGTPEATAAGATFASWGKKTVMKAGVLDVVPFFLMNLDAGFEDGKWANWPPIPAPIKWGLVNLVGGWYGGRWRFASCDGAGGRKELFALA